MIKEEIQQRIKSWLENTLLRINWHILWNENLTLQLSYDLDLGCSTFFPTVSDYDSSYPWIRLTFMHLMGVRPVQTYCWKKVRTSHLPSPTYNVIICQLFFALKRFFSPTTTTIVHGVVLEGLEMMCKLSKTNSQC